MSMEGAGPVTGPILMAEIGDVRRFKNKKNLLRLLVWMHRRSSQVHLSPNHGTSPNVVRHICAERCLPFRG